MGRPRLRLRTLMVVVAVAALALWVADVCRRQREYARRAADYRAVGRFSGAYMTPEMHAWCRTMAEFYERAARRPWVSPGPEPSEP